VGPNTMGEARRANSHLSDEQFAAAIAALDPIEELSIGHAIISRAVFSGLDLAVRDMCAIVENGSYY